MRKALITGIAGQDGSYLADLLLDKGYQVHGLLRPGGEPLDNLFHCLPRLLLTDGNLLDPAFAKVLLETTQPDEIYHFAAISFVPASWNNPLASVEFNALGVQRLLEAIRHHRPQARFFQASSSEMFGPAPWSPQDESTPFAPKSLYGLAKLYAHHVVGIYRDTFGLFACSGILFNHESPRRPVDFVTRKITHAAVQIKNGLAHELRLGNLKARRDWGFAGDYVRAMWLMLQQDKPDDFVIGTGDVHTVEDFVALAFARVGLDWNQHVINDANFYRPAEPTPLVADASKARTVLGWQPQISFPQLVEMMVDADVALRQRAAAA